MADVERLCQEAVDSVTEADWVAADRHGQGIENEIWEVDGLIDNMIDSFVIYLSAC